MSRARRPRQPHVPLRSATYTRSEGEWIVRSVPGSTASDRTYRCPGCDQMVAGTAPHVVAWPAGEYGSVEDRRHWHATCWAARDRRGPGHRRR